MYIDQAARSPAATCCVAWLRSGLNLFKSFCKSALNSRSMAFKSTVALVDAFRMSFVLVVNIQLTTCQKATTLLLRVCFSNQFIDN
jgi:uncharacterized protein (DUF486 family)